MPLLREYLQVPISAEVASQHFWDLNLLRRFWTSITSAEAIYDDGANQECLMSVHRDGKDEHIRIIRFRDQFDIEFFNPEPPPMMTFHRGAWRFRLLPEGGCQVVAERNYKLIQLSNESRESFTQRTDQFNAKFAVRIVSLLAAFYQSIIEADRNISARIIAR
jgi:hypothetical protein